MVQKSSVSLVDVCSPQDHGLLFPSWSHSGSSIERAAKTSLRAAASHHDAAAQRFLPKHGPQQQPPPSATSAGCSSTCAQTRGPRPLSVRPETLTFGSLPCSPGLWLLTNDSLSLRLRQPRLSKLEIFELFSFIQRP